jgi:hypothetical protein
MLDTLGGLSGGLGGSGGTGGSLPSNQSAANSSASAAINPTATVTLGGGGLSSVGNFSIQFPPPIQLGAGDDVNAPPALTGFNSSTLLFVGLGALLLIVFFAIRKG